MNLLSPILPFVAAVALLLAAGSLWWWRARRTGRPAPLPREWALTARPVFSTDERRVYRALREAVPHHVVLSKLPLVRFCQPTNPDEIAYWYELLGTIHVTFAICSANGRVLAAIDLDTERGISRRVLQIKQAVLGTCRVRYLRCPVDHLPSVAELQLLVPHSGPPVRAPQPAPIPTPAVATPFQMPTAVPSSATRRGRATLWQDSGFFHDSFFAPDNRSEAFQTSDTGHPAARAAGRPAPSGALGGSTSSASMPGLAGSRNTPAMAATPPRSTPRSATADGSLPHR